MVIRGIMLMAALGGLLIVVPTRGYGASKETVELQEQIRALQDQVAKLQEEVRADLAVLKHNSNETTNNMKQMTDWAQKVDAAMKQQTADADTCADQVSGSSIALRQQLQEMRSRLEQISHDVQVNRPATPPAAAPAVPPGNTNPTQ
jgi:small-conductance mechanosensitive channel